MLFIFFTAIFFVDLLINLDQLKIIDFDCNLKNFLKYKKDVGGRIFDKKIILKSLSKYEFLALNKILKDY